MQQAETAAEPAPLPAPTTEDAQAPVAATVTESPTEQSTGVLGTSLLSTSNGIANARIDQGLNWSRCNLPQVPSAAMLSTLPDGMTEVEADGATLLRNENLAIFTGNVQVRQEGGLLEADDVQHNRDTDDMDATGNGYLEQDGVRIAGPVIHYNLNSRTGHAEQADYRLLDRTSRGYADKAVIDGPGLSHFTNVSYTTCRPGEDHWQIKADEMEINQTTGIGVAHDATLAIMGVPVLYTPYFSFPIDDRRKSGFLVPSIGSTDNTGIDLSTPYYFNIAPHMDATFTPRYMSKRGLLLGGEFRYLASNYSGQIKAEILHNDTTRASTENSTRGAYQFRFAGAPASRWSYEIAADYVSDSDYLEDLGSSLAASSATHQERRGDIKYNGDGWNFSGRVQSYQTVDNNIALSSRPYRLMPQLRFNIDRPDQPYGLTYHLGSEYSRFDHESSAKVKGQRIDLTPSVSLPFDRSWGFLRPKLSLRHTHYSLTDQGAGIASSQSRTLPTLSIDSGLFFDRETNWFGANLEQTLEPHLYYLYTPYEDQSSLPVFDTGELGLSFGNLFSENRFSGPDRVGDANQLTAALTTRTLDGDSGTELFRTSVGQTLYFRDRDVQLPGHPIANDDSSSTFIEVAGAVGDHWKYTTDIQWNPQNGSGVEKSAVSLKYLDDDQRILNLAYRYTKNSIGQLDLSGRLPVTHKLSLVGRYYHSIRDKQLLEAFAGVEYDNCCWSTRLVARQYRTSATADPIASVFLQVELKGLTSIGDRLDQFLEEGILGYSSAQ